MRVPGPGGDDAGGHREAEEGGGPVPARDGAAQEQTRRPASQPQELGLCLGQLGRHGASAATVEWLSGLGEHWVHKWRGVWCHLMVMVCSRHVHHLRDMSRRHTGASRQLCEVNSIVCQSITVIASHTRMSNCAYCISHVGILFLRRRRSNAAWCARQVGGARGGRGGVTCQTRFVIMIDSKL